MLTPRWNSYTIFVVNGNFRDMDTTDYRTIEFSDPLEEISDLFGGKSLPEGRKSFCSAFVLFLRT